MIRSTRNPLVQDIRRIRRSKDDRCLLEGKHLLLEALRSGFHPDPVLVTPEAAEDPEIRIALAALPHSPVAIGGAVMAKVTDSRNPTGIVSVVRLSRPHLAQLPALEGLWLYLDGLQDPGNLGSLARVAEATGVKAVCLGPGSAHPNHPRALRASAGSLLRLPACRQVDPDELARHLEGRPWLGLEAHGGIDPFAHDFPPSAILALGGEGPGLSPATRRLLTTRISIPLAEPVESLNATVAAAIVLFEIRRRLP